LIGKINEAKLANFQEVDIFVNIACPFSAVFETKGFVKDVVTPLEVELALNDDREWSGEYCTAFSNLLNSGEVPDEVKEPTSPRYSLVKRCVVSRSEDNEDDDEMHSSKQLVEVNGHKSLIPLDDASGVVMQERVRQRNYNGLEPAYGETPVEGIHIGLTGIARRYENQN
jgi:diphthamide biosynthesis protein 2